MKRRLLQIVTGLIIIGLSAGFGQAGEDVFPSKTITWIVPASPGGGLDSIARGIASAMPKYLPGERGGVVIKNVSQPMGIRGLETLQRSEPNGYTILNNYIDGSILQQFRLKPEWDLRKYTFLGQTFLSRFTVCVSAKSPYATVQDLINSKTTLRWAVITGDSQHLYTVMTADGLGVKSTYIRGYAGTRDLPIALIRGEADIIVVPVEVGNAFVPGDLKILFSLSQERLVKDKPSAKEIGYDNLSNLASVQVVLGPPGVPKNIAGILEEALHKTVTDQDVQAWAKRVGFTLVWKSAAEAAKIALDSYARYEKYYPLLEAGPK